MGDQLKGHVCAVCGARTNEHLHYGSLVCDSCRVFFRRAVNTPGRPDWSCRTKTNSKTSSTPSFSSSSSNSSTSSPFSTSFQIINSTTSNPTRPTCTISSRLKSMCRSCRYAKCLQVGMSPEQVDKVKRAINDFYNNSNSTDNINTYGSDNINTNNISSDIINSNSNSIQNSQRYNNTNFDNSSNKSSSSFSISKSNISSNSSSPEFSLTGTLSSPSQSLSLDTASHDSSTHAPTMTPAGQDRLKTPSESADSQLNNRSESADSQLINRSESADSQLINMSDSAESQLITRFKSADSQLMPTTQMTPSLGMSLSSLIIIGESYTPEDLDYFQFISSTFNGFEARMMQEMMANPQSRADLESYSQQVIACHVTGSLNLDYKTFLDSSKQEIGNQTMWSLFRDFNSNLGFEDLERVSSLFCKYSHAFHLLASETYSRMTHREFCGNRCQKGMELAISAKILDLSIPNILRSNLFVSPWAQNSRLEELFLSTAQNFREGFRNQVELVLGMGLLICSTSQEAGYDVNTFVSYGHILSLLFKYLLRKTRCSRQANVQLSRILKVIKDVKVCSEILEHASIQGAFNSDGLEDLDAISIQELL